MRIVYEVLRLIFWAVICAGGIYVASELFPVHDLQNINQDNSCGRDR